MNLDKNTKFPISLYYIFSVNISVKIYPKQFLPGNYILWTRNNYTYGNFLKIRQLQIWKINAFSRSLFWFWSIFYSIDLSAKIDTKVYSKTLRKNFRKQFFTYILQDHVADFSISILENSHFEIEMIHFQAWLISWCTFWSN